MKIDIFTTEKSWMHRYNIRFLEHIKKLGHDAIVISSKEDIRTGDVIFFLGCWEIIPAQYLARHLHNLAIHASDLPRGKGWSPCSWQILEGKKEIPISLFEACNKVDSGPVYLRDYLHLEGNELLSEWQRKLGEKIIDMAILMVEQYDTYIAQGKVQTGEESFFPRRRPEDSKLDLNKSIGEQFNLLRIVDNDNYPAFFEKDGERFILKIYKI